MVSGAKTPVSTRFTTFYGVCMPSVADFSGLWQERRVSKGISAWVGRVVWLASQHRKFDYYLKNMSICVVCIFGML